MRVFGRSVDGTGLLAAGVVAGFIATGFSAARAEGAERKVAGALFLQYNHSAVVADLEANWTWKLSKSENLIVKDAHFAIGVGNQLSPGHDALRAWVELSPLSIVDLRAGVEGVAYFGTFGHLVGFPGYGSDMTDDALILKKDEAVSRSGRRFYFSPALKMRLGRVSFRSGADFESWKIHRAPGTVVYEPIRATGIASAGASLVNVSTVVLFDVSRGGAVEKLRIGAMHDYLRVWDAPENDKKRVGAIAIAKLGESLFGARKPELVVSAFGYVGTRNREGFGAFAALTFAIGGAATP